MRKRKKEKVNKTTMNETKNEYSIFEYLKKNPSVFITTVTALVALITIMAKIVTYISACKKLKYWEIDLSYAQFGGESLVYIVIIAMLYTFFNTIGTIWYAATYDVYLSYKKTILVMKYYINNSKKIIKDMKRRYKNDDNDEEAKKYLDSIESIRSCRKDAQSSSRKDLWFYSLPILLLFAFSSLLYVACCGMTSDINKLLLFIICILTQIVMMCIQTLIYSNNINKKKLMEQSKDIEFVERQVEERNFKNYPMREIKDSGIFLLLNNSKIVIAVMTLLINCFTLSIVYSLTPVDIKETNESFQITCVDDVTYAIVYQRENRYFLEEVDVEVTEEDNKKNLIIYTDRQRIITTDDIIIQVGVYDEIKCEHREK